MFRFLKIWTGVSHGILTASICSIMYGEIREKDIYVANWGEGASMGASLLTRYGNCVINKNYRKNSEAKKEIKVGDIVSYELGDKHNLCRVRHRIISMNPDGTNIITKGDGNNVDDLKGRIITKPLMLDDIKSKSIARIPLIYLPCAPTLYIIRKLISKFHPLDS